MSNPYRQITEMLLEARQARAAIRHALQFLKDPTHKGDGHLDECIDSCEDALKTDGKWDLYGKRKASK